MFSSFSGPPFGPLSPCSLRDLSRKVLFLVSLGTARRVGELQAVSAVVSSSREDLFLSYLPEFRAKSESEARPLPHSFRVRSLAGFLVTFRMSSFSVLFVLFISILLGLLLFPLVLVLFSFLLVLPLVLFLRMPSVSSFGMSLRSLILRLAFLFRRSPLPLLCLPLLLILVVRCMLMGFGVSLLLGLFTVTLLRLLSWSPLPGFCLCLYFFLFV